MKKKEEKNERKKEKKQKKSRESMDVCIRNRRKRVKKKGRDCRRDPYRP